jgi:hypothetical protein
VTIEVTDEMREAFERAAGECAGIDVRGGLTAVLAIVERGYLRVDNVHRDGRKCRPGNRCVYCEAP